MNEQRVCVKCAIICQKYLVFRLCHLVLFWFCLLTFFPQIRKTHKANKAVASQIPLFAHISERVVDHRANNPESNWETLSH
jgi:cell division septal protein FtsQ